MAREVKISPSLLSADMSKLGEDVRRLQDAGADMLHVDVMDGHFVPNITIGPFVVEAIRKIAAIPLDVHLMITDPDKYLEPFADAGSDHITFHIEAVEEAGGLIKEIQSKNITAGICVSPDTPAEALADVAGDVDMILVMSVYPGFGGQKFMERVLPKTEALRAMAPERVNIEIDGGITADNVARAGAAGANVIVAGTAVFKADDMAAAIEQLRTNCRNALK
ncbi:MAG: ribulose-phosphate 3-epimerase [Planctomycetes bacterium]|nr:ribulose-phosphate 3-epimerase [Planctomycetota bacterium]